MELETPSATGDRLNYLALWPILIVGLICLVESASIGSELTFLHFFADAGADYVLLIFVLTLAFRLISALLMGHLSDRYGRRLVLIGAQGIALAGLILMGMVEPILLKIVVMLVPVGVTFGSLPVLYAVIADSTSPKTRTQAFGVAVFLFSAGLGISSFIAAMIASGRNLSPIVGILPLLSLVVIWFRIPETRLLAERSAHEIGAWSVLKTLQSPLVVILLILLFVQQTVFSGLDRTLQLFRVSRVGQWVSIESLFVGVIVLAVQVYFIGRWSRRWGDRRLIYRGMAILALGIILVLLTPSQPVPGYVRVDVQDHVNLLLQGRDAPIPLPEQNAATGLLGLGWFLLAMIPVMIGGSIFQPAINSLLTQQVAMDEYGKILGVSLALIAGADVLSPLFGAALTRLGGPTVPLVARVAAMAVLLIMILSLNRTAGEKPNTISPV
jgi:MFS family permease